MTIPIPGPDADAGTGTDPNPTPTPTGDRAPGVVPATSAPTPAPPRGALPFGLGLISLVFLPFLSLIVAGIVMALVGSAQRKRGGLAAVNGRRAANWGLTLIVIMVPMTALWIVALSIQAQGFFPWGISVIVWVVLGIANLVVAIYGLVSASSGREARVPAIPFLR